MAEDSIPVDPRAVKLVAPAGTASQYAPTTTSPSQARSPNRPVADKWAVIVGVSQFKDPNIPQLKFAAKDARDFYDYLTKSAGFAPDHVRLLLNEQATQRRVMSELGDRFLARAVGPDDLVVVFLSSHGSPADRDVRGRNFLIAHDTEKSDMFASGIKMQDFCEVLKDSVQSDRIVVILDACHSGASQAGGKDLGPSANFDCSQIVQGAGQLIICSSSPDQRSWESTRYPNGIFTRSLISSLGTASAPRKLQEAFGEVEKSVEKEVRQDMGVRQTPVLKSAWNGEDLVIASRATAPEPLPESIKHILLPDSLQLEQAKKGVAPAINHSAQNLAVTPFQPGQPAAIKSNVPPKPAIVTVGPTTPSVVNNVTSNATPASSRVKDKWALVIGISKFKDPAMNLKYAAKDAQDFYNYLTQQAKFPKDHVLLLLNERATRENFVRAFGDNFLPAVVKPGDQVVVYISTHGASILGSRNYNYVMAYDTEADKILATGVELKYLSVRAKNALKTDQSLIIMDTCFTGSGTPGTTDAANFDATQVSQDFGHPVIFSSASTERSWESKVSQNGVFTKYLIQSLQRTGGHLKQAFDSLKAGVEWEVQSTYGQTQHPALGGELKADGFNFRAEPTEHRPILDRELIKLIDPTSVDPSKK